MTAINLSSSCYLHLYKIQAPALTHDSTDKTEVLSLHNEELFWHQEHEGLSISKIISKPFNTKQRSKYLKNNLFTKTKNDLPHEEDSCQRYDTQYIF